MNRLYHRSIGEVFMNIFLDLSINISHFSSSTYVCALERTIEGHQIGVQHRYCVVPFVTRCPISIIRPNRSSRFIDWCEVSPCLLSSASMSSMIVFSVWVRRYGSGKGVSGRVDGGVLGSN